LFRLVTAKGLEPIVHFVSPQPKAYLICFVSSQPMADAPHTAGAGLWGRSEGDRRGSLIREHITDQNASLAERSAIAKKEINKDNATEQERLCDEIQKPPVDEDKEDQGMMAAATAGLIGDRLHNTALWNVVPMDYVNVHTEWCAANAPNSEKLVLVQPTLCDAHVIGIDQCRKFIAMGMEMVILFDADEANTVRPPHAELIAEFCRYSGLGELGSK
jgi:hypothetical protein